jgi:hypothetical protein
VDEREISSGAESEAVETFKPLEQFDLGNDMWVMKVAIEDLLEQEINAQTMPPRQFEQLAANIKERGALESLAYCVWPGRRGRPEIVSGHHRIRASRAAGMKTVWVLMDVGEISRSKIVAKQLAHNALVGSSDTQIVKQLLRMIDNPQDLLMTGLDEKLLGAVKESEKMTMFTPTIDVEWRTVSFVFLPHQLDNLKELFEELADKQDLVIVGLGSQYKQFMEAATKVGRIKEIRSGGSVIALLTETALAVIRDSTPTRAEGETVHAEQA